MLKDLRNAFFIEIGGILWWGIIRFCRTRLEEETSDKYKARNVLFLFIFILFFIRVKLFD